MWMQTVIVSWCELAIKGYCLLVKRLKEIRYIVNINMMMTWLLLLVINTIIFLQLALITKFFAFIWCCIRSSCFIMKTYWTVVQLNEQKSLSTPLIQPLFSLYDRKSKSNTKIKHEYQHIDSHHHLCKGEYLWENALTKNL